MSKKRKKRKVNKLHQASFLSSKFYQSFLSGEVNLLDEISIKKFKNITNEVEKPNFVSSFSGWVLNADKGNGNINQLKRGNKLEKSLSKKLKYDSISSEEDYRRIKYEFLDNDWVLEYEDISLKNRRAFKISSLEFNGKPFYGRPDVVYRNIKTNDRIIVEIKNTGTYNNSIPDGGWFNLQCQLWSYSWIDNFIDSPNIFLYGDIRKMYTLPNWNGTQIKISEPSGQNPGWRIRKNGVLNIDNDNINNLHNQCLELFEYYGGDFISR
jgi:hypothetical protein